MSKVQDSAITEQMKRDVLEYMGYKQYQIRFGVAVYKKGLKILTTEPKEDLNFLFEVAGKIQMDYDKISESFLPEHYYHSICPRLEDWIWECFENHKAPAEALFLALYQAIKALKEMK